MCPDQPNAPLGRSVVSSKPSDRYCPKCGKMHAKRPRVVEVAGERSQPVLEGWEQEGKNEKPAQPDTMTTSRDRLDKYLLGLGPAVITFLGVVVAAVITGLFLLSSKAYEPAPLPVDRPAQVQSSITDTLPTPAPPTGLAP